MTNATFLGSTSSPAPPSRASSDRPVHAPLAPRGHVAAPPDLARVLGLNGIFRVVRRVVRDALGRERTGLGLAYSNLPPGIGAYWPVTGNVIVLNESLLGAMRSMAKSDLEFNSFVYVILAHEYLHSLGYWGEGPVRAVTAKVTRAAFGEGHPATEMAEGDLWQLYPFLQMVQGGDGSRIRIISGFDTDTTSSYIR